MTNITWKCNKYSIQAVAINTANNADIFVKGLRKDRHDELLKKALNSSLESISMLGTVSNNLSKTRRSRLKFGLNSSTNSICDLRYEDDNSQGRSSDYLFGDDLAETISRGDRHKKLAASIQPQQKDTFVYPKNPQVKQYMQSDFCRPRGNRRPPNNQYHRGRSANSRYNNRYSRR